MNTVNYNDAEQLFGAVGTSLKKHTAEIADIVNVYGAKNLLKTSIESGTTQGVTYTINADGSITLNGTCAAWTNIKLDYISGQKNIPSGSYILNGSISGNNKFRLNTFVDGTKVAESQGGNEASFTIPSTATEVYTRFEIDSTATFNHETFYPMIRLASITDDTYVPYVPTNAELLSADTNAVLGAHNLVDVSIDRASLYGVDFTNEGDNKIKLNGTCSTATANGVYKMHLKPGTYIASIQVLSGSHNTAKTLWIERRTGTTAINPDITITTETYKERQFTVSTEGDYGIQIGIARNDVFDNLVLGYMIRLASDPSTAYAPYAKSNKELTDDISSLAARIKAIEDTNHLTWG